MQVTHGGDDTHHASLILLDAVKQSYLMLSTHRKSRFQRILDDSGFWSGHTDHQMNRGLPTIWSSGTKPQ